MINILIVDDDIDLCSLMTLALKASYRVHSLHNLQDARAYVPWPITNLLLLDNSLPDGKGVDFIREALRLNPTIKIVLITADLAQYVQHHAMEAGAAEYLAKPFDTATLNKTIKRVLPSMA